MWRILISISLVSLVAAQSLHFQPHDSATVNNIICPDKQGTCPDETTCCLLTSGKYGCCPMPQATCCSDHLHCCPRGYKCNMELMSCSQGNKTLAMVLKQAANPVTKANDVVCPGGQSQCPGVSTCCKLLSGKWGCCPLPKATCCQDGTHCCPAGYQCNTATSSCQKAGNSNSWFMLKPAGVTQTKSGASTKKISFPSGRQMVKPVSHKKKLCPGGQTFCDGGKTCCFKDKWHFTCCPFINGVCCHGAEHCCPLGFSCDMKLGKCTKGEEIVLPWGHTHESKTAHEPEPEDSGPSFFKTLLSLILDTFIDYEQDDEDDDDDDDERDKAKRTKATESLKGTAKTKDGGQNANLKKSSSQSKTTEKVTVSSNKELQVSKTNPKLMQKNLKKVEPAKKVNLKNEARSTVDLKTVGNAGTGGKNVHKDAKPQKVTSNIPPEPKTVIASVGTVRKGLDNTAGKAGLKTVKHNEKLTEKLAQSKTVPKNLKTKDSKSSPSIKSVRSGIEKGGKHKLKDQSSATLKKTSPRVETSGTKPTKPAKKSASPLVHPPPKMQIKLQVKKIIEPKTSTRIDEGKPKDLPMVSPRTNHKPRVKSVLKPISKPPGTSKKDVPKKNVDSEKLIVGKKDLKKSVISQKSVTSKDQKLGMKEISKIQARVPVQVPIKVESKIVGSKMKPAQKVGSSSSIVDQKSSTKPESKVQHKKKVVLAVPSKVEAKVPKVDAKSSQELLPKNEHEVSKTMTKLPSKLQQKVETKHTIKMPSKVDQKVETTRTPKVTSKVKPKLETRTTPKVLPKVEQKIQTKIPLPPNVAPKASKDILAKTISKAQVDSKVQKKVVSKLSTARDEKEEVSFQSMKSEKFASELPQASRSANKKLEKKPIRPGSAKSMAKALPLKPVKQPAKSVLSKPNVSMKSAKKPLSLKPTGQPGSLKTVVKLGIPSPVEPPATRNVALKHSSPKIIDKHKTTKEPSTAKSTVKTEAQKASKLFSKQNKIPVTQKTADQKIGQSPKSKVKTPEKSGKANTEKRPPILKVIGNPTLARALLMKSKSNRHNVILKDELDDKYRVAVDLIEQIEVDEGTVSCPDGKSSCPDGSTCCLLLSGKYGCCPLEQAVCCSDHLHCCPHGSVCDVEAQTCQQGIETIPWSEKSPAIPTTSNSDDLVGGDTIVCPGGQATCPDGSTCCLLESGQYGCCPLQEAVCCADHLHCCPKGTTCDPKSETCNKGSYNIPWSMKFPAEPRMHKANNECSDNKTSCSESTTCCLMLDGYYACCPFENAKCCPDKLHCCPSNQVCDVTKGECVNPKGVSMSMLEKLPSTPDLANIVCPDEKTCPAGSTCCQISVGLFGCCPMEKAVCCSDHVHCCPEGYTCDVTTAKCTSHGLTVPWVAKSPSRPMTNEGSSPLTNVICPDKVSFCPDQTTCCMLSTQQYGCCPLPNAACCKDGVHCCPSGYKCDTVKGTCDKAALSIPWAEKFAAEPVTVSAGWVVCPDKASQCQDGETCCKQATGQYGCCPLPKAVCCSDGAHCCPEGSTCDVAKGTCSSTSNSLVISWSMIRRTTPVLLTDTPQNVEPVTCPDKTTCPQGSTCCMMKSGAYGCCPYSEGSCCSDQVHCCPKGFHCDKTGRSCETIDSSLSLTSTMFTRFKTQPTQDNTLTVQIVKCPGGKEQCPDGSTCCKQPSGQFGCCKFDNAVCCSDGVHCCPQGFACDPQSGTCTQAVPWTTKLPATPIPPAESELGEMLVESDMPFSAVVCPDRQHQCPDGSTCCKLGTGVWGCCAFPQAVCCDDGVHCCPRGYTCLVQQGQCVTQTHATSLAFIAMASSTSDTYN